MQMNTKNTCETKESQITVKCGNSILNPALKTDFLILYDMLRNLRRIRLRLIFSLSAFAWFLVSI